MGLEPLWYLSPVLPVKVMPLLTDGKGDASTVIVVYLLLVVLIGIYAQSIARLLGDTGRKMVPS